MHYLNDYLTLGHQGPQECQNNLQTILVTSRILGVPLALKKVEGPAIMLKFLGINIDTVHMEAWLPIDKLDRIWCLVAEWLRLRQPREILSLVGLPPHAAKLRLHFCEV